MALSRSSRLSLQWRLPLLLGALLVIVISALCGAAYLALRGSSEQAATARLEQVNSQLVELLQAQAVGLRHNAAGAAAHPAVAAYFHSPQPRRAEAVRAFLGPAFRADSQLVAAQLLAPDGSTLVSLGPMATTIGGPPDPRDLPGHAGVPESTSVGRMRAVGDDLVFPSIATTWARGQAAGHLVLWRRTGGHQRPGARSPIATLIGTGARLHIGTPGAGWMNGEGISTAPDLPPADTAATSGIVHYTSAQDGAVIARIAPVPGTPWLVVLEFPASAVYAAADRFLDRIVLIGTALLLIGLVSAWVVSRHLIAPLVQLTEATDAFGSGRLGTRVPEAGTGEIRHLAEAFNAMAERRDRAVAAREASEAQWRLLFDQNPRPMWVADRRSGQFLAVNEAALELYGLGRTEFLARGIADLRASEADQDAPAGEPRVTPFERHRVRDGSTVEVEITRHRVLFAGEPAELALVQNITARKVQEAQARQAQKMEAVGRLAGGVAHDFNNLLAIITPYAELLREEAPAGSRQREDLEQILAAAERGRALTRQLLTFSRQRVVQAATFDLNDGVRGVERLLRRLLGEDIELVTRLDATRAHIRVDPGQFEQVLINLAVNARDAMPEGGHLILTTAEWTVDLEGLNLHGLQGPGRYVTLTVTDTGTGMDAATCARVFEPFFTTKEPGKGTGIGLATVYGIVTQNGGQITVYSEPGSGATFRLYFPVVQESSAPAEAAAAARPMETLRGQETVLLVEDDAAVRNAATDVLERFGYTVLVATGAEDAQELAARHRRAIDLVISDVVMPRMSGPALLASLRRHRPDLRVLLVSGYAGEALAVRGDLAPEIPFLEKPFTVVGLLTKVRAVLDGMAT